MRNPYDKYFQIINDVIGQRLTRIIQEEREKEKKRGYIDFRVPDLERFFRNLSEKDFNELDKSLWTSISSFWDRNLQSVLSDVKKNDCSKALYLREDLHRPPFFSGIIRKTAMYTDKIVLIDPIRYCEVIKIGNQVGAARKFVPVDAVYMIALSEWIENDIVDIVPQPELWDAKTNAKLRELIESDTPKISRGVKMVDVIRSNGKHERHIPRNKMTKAMLNGISETSQRLSSKMNNVLFASESLHCNPTTDWGEDFYYWEWKLKQDGKSLSLDAKIMFALNKYPIKWFGPIALENILDIRKKNMLVDLRVSLREIFSEIGNTQSDEFEETMGICQEKLRREIKRSESEWNNIKKDLVEKVTLGSSAAIVSGLLSAMASPMVSIPSLYGALIGGGITSIGLAFNEIAELRSKMKDLKLNPIYLLFKAQEKTGLQRESSGLIGPNASIGFTQGINFEEDVE